MSTNTATQEKQKKVLVPIGNGSEEIEATSIIDTLRRAGAEVTVASVEDTLKVVCSRGLRIEAEVKIKEVENVEFDVIVLPGGMPGAERLRDNEILRTLLFKQKENDKLIAAICAAPVVVLQHHGLLTTQNATSHPNFFSKLSKPTEGRVVVDGNLITSRSPGTAIEFSLVIIEHLFGKQKAKEVESPMLVNGYQ